MVSAELPDDGNEGLRTAGQEMTDNVNGIDLHGQKGVTTASIRSEAAIVSPGPPLVVASKTNRCRSARCVRKHSGSAKFLTFQTIQGCKNIRATRETVFHVLAACVVSKAERLSSNQAGAL